MSNHDTERHHKVELKMDEITSKFKNAFERMAELESLQLSMEEDTDEDMKEKWRHERFENSKKDGFQEEEGVCSVFNYMSVLSVAVLTRIFLCRNFPVFIIFLAALVRR